MTREQESSMFQVVRHVMPRVGRTVRHPNENLLRDACFDETGQYRYKLSRVWDPDGTQLTAVMLNPSAANVQDEDQTVYGMIERAAALGHGKLVVVNVFAAIATFPEDLYSMKDPIGPLNDLYIQGEHRAADVTIVGWGNHAAKRIFGGRHKRVVEMLQQIRPVYAFKVNKNGTPRHPLYEPYNAIPDLYQPLL